MKITWGYAWQKQEKKRVELLEYLRTGTSINNALGTDQWEWVGKNIVRRRSIRLNQPLN